MIISICHAKGGVAKTTLSLNIAARLKPELIMDQDQHRGISVLNEIREKKYNVMSGHSDRDLIEACKNSNGNILIDCGGFDSDSNRKAAALSDILLIPCNPDPTETIGLNYFNRTLGEINEAYGIIINAKIVITKFHPNRKNFHDAMSFFSKMTNASVLNSKVPYCSETPEMMKLGLGVIEHKKTKHSRAARYINNLCDELGIC